ncbi:GNAT family N-acetyltransferase [Bacillus alkalicola]|uniref:GNAT family N-acetyltransferase n=2 Tax=Bacillales TaxID=1385 RepID=A0ABS6K094_9BACI|nr:GNAT family N-acetyltransferase [Bacillus alkalicola]
MIKQLDVSDATVYWDLRLEGFKTNPKAFANTYEEAIKRENPIDTAKKQLSSKSSYTFGAFINGELMGSATLMLSQYKKMAHKGDILGMYVSPKARKAGVGKKLVEAVIVQGKKCGLEQLRLMVVSDNEAAKAFYKTFGFETYGIEKNAIKYEGEYFDEDLMVLFI